MTKKVICYLCIAVLFWGCVAVTDTTPLLTSLADKGTVILDPSNPYLAASRLIKEEKEQSSVIQGFFSVRGEPSALEVTSKKAQPQLILKLYYSDLFERYELEKTTADWVISGPFPDQSVPRNLATPKAVNTPIPTPSFAPTAHIRPTPYLPLTSKAAIKPTIEVEETSTVVPTPSPEENIAEITPRGDLVHYVTFPGETISIIARWYTNDRDNAPKIARLNQLKNANVLQIGDTIVIPSYMIKNKKRISEESLKEIQNKIKNN